MLPDETKLRARPANWENTLRMKLAFLCMAVSVGEDGDLKAMTEDIIHFARVLSGAEDASVKPPQDR